jgi:regulator of cell morphogenesis and NO signaling
MADLVHLNYLLLNVLNRFNISLGFADASVEEVCKKYQIDVNFFLDIANTYHHKDYFPQKQLQRYPVKTILQYLRNTHIYYLEKKLPELELLLKQTIKICYKDEKTSQLIISFFSGYKDQLTRHIEKEEREVFPYVYWLENTETDGSLQKEMVVKYLDYSIEHYKNTHDDVEEKLTDLQNLIVKYLPRPADMYACNKLLFEIFALENDLNDHSRIEEKVMIPKALSMEKSTKEKITKFSN